MAGACDGGRGMPLGTCLSPAWLSWRTPTTLIAAAQPCGTAEARLERTATAGRAGLWACSSRSRPTWQGSSNRWRACNPWSRATSWAPRSSSRWASSWRPRRGRPPSSSGNSSSSRAAGQRERQKRCGEGGAAVGGAADRCTRSGSARFRLAPGSLAVTHSAVRPPARQAAVAREKNRQAQRRFRCGTITCDAASGPRIEALLPAEATRGEATRVGACTRVRHAR